MRKRLKTDSEIESQTKIVRKDLIAGRVGRLYSRAEIRKAEEKIVPWYRGEKDGNSFGI